jgi:SAM-dependent methyltransferase
VQDFRGLNRQQWHQRYVDQAGWTAQIRKYIFNKIKPSFDVRILEVGSGTGAVMGALHNHSYCDITGVDLDFPSLAFSKAKQLFFNQVMGDGHHLPFKKALFGVTLCHYLLMWTAHPAQILSEMRRVTQPGGWVLALAEPDHQSRIDYPPALDILGKHQTQSLKEQGADVCLGRKLRSLFIETGLMEVETGILAAQWHQNDHSTADETEWIMIQADLKDRISQSELADLKHRDQEARKTSQRVLFIPTFYAFGKVP